MLSGEIADLAASVTALVANNPTPDVWRPGSLQDDQVPTLHSLLGEVGWHDLADDPDSIRFIGPSAVALGRKLVALTEIDSLLGGSPLVGGLVRYTHPGGTAIVRDREGTRQVRVLAAHPVPYGDCLGVREVTETQDLGSGDPGMAALHESAWICASVGYLAGLADAALSIALAYAGQREAFGGSLLEIGAVQQRLADAATGATGLLLLAEVTAECHQIVGAIGYTLDFPLQRYSRRARAVQLWADAWTEAMP